VNGNHVNLLPVGYRRRLEMRTLVLYWASLAILIIVGCTMVTNWTKLRVANMAAKVADLQIAGEQVEDLMVSNDLTKQQLRELQFLNGHLDSMVPTDDLLQTLGVIATIKSAAEHPPRVRALSMNLRGASLPQQAATNGSAAENSSYQSRGNVARAAAEAQLVLSLFGTDQGQIQQWMQDFAASPRVRGVQLGRSGIDAHTGGYEAEIQAQDVVQKELP
jgi:hypothetical protein